MAGMTPDQQSLFLAALPHPFRVVPTADMLPALSEDEVKKWTPADWKIWQARGEAMQAHSITLSKDTLRRARLQAHLTADFSFDVPGQSGYGIGVSPAGSSTSPGSDGPYTLTNYGSPADDQSGELGAYIRIELPNTLKDGDLRWTQRALDADVPLKGLKTVGDLVTRLAKATHLELHCDPHFAPLPLLLRGDTNKPHPADEVMQALTLCVCGAWRQIGPACVLTDDVEGVAARRAALKDIVAIWGNRLDTAAKGIGGHLEAQGWTSALAFAPRRSGGAAPSLMGKVAAQSGSNSGFGVPLAWRELPPSFQVGIKRGLDDLRNSRRTLQRLQSGSGAGSRHEVYAQLNMRLAVAVPGYGTLPLMLGNEYRVPRPGPSSPPASGAPAKPAPLRLTEKMRGILCAPDNPDHARQVVDRIAGMGLNVLFCDVFTGGRTFFPNSALPPVGGASGVLAAAIAEGRAKGVAVYAVLDTLCWRTEGPSTSQPPLPPGFTEDLTVQGETQSENIRRRSQTGSLDPQELAEWVMPRLGTRRWVSPANTRVQVLLPALVQAVAATPGLAGLAFQDTAAPGYLGGGDMGDTASAELGYTPQIRLARLRAGEADPVDVGGVRDTTLYLRSQDANVFTSLNTALPLLGQDEMVVTTSWNQSRADADHVLLASLYAAAREAAPQMPLLMRERRIGFTFDPWTDPRQLNEAKSLASEGNELGARATRASILAVTLDYFTRQNLGFLPDEVQQSRQEFGNGLAGGILLDLVTGSPGSDPLRDMDLLAPFFPAVAGK